MKNGVLSPLAGTSDCDRTGVLGRDVGLLGVEISFADWSHGLGNSSAGVTEIDGTSDDSGVGNMGGVRSEDDIGCCLVFF